MKAKEVAKAFDSVGLDIDLHFNFMDTSQRGEEAEQVPSSNPNPTEPTLDDERELSYADINQKRKQLTFQSFQDPSFLQKITILDSLIQPNVGAMYKMFQRTGILGKLCYLPEDARDDKQELMNKPLTLNIFGHGVWHGMSQDSRLISSMIQ